MLSIEWYSYQISCFRQEIVLISKVLFISNIIFVRRRIQWVRIELGTYFHINIRVKFSMIMNILHLVWLKYTIKAKAIISPG